MLGAGDDEVLHSQSARLYRKRGECRLAAGASGAKADFELALQTLESLPAATERRIARAVCLYNLYAIERERGAAEPALEYCGRSLEQLRILQSNKSLDPKYEPWIELLESDRQQLALAAGDDR